MVYLPPPNLASASRPSYAEAYAQILASHRRSPLTSASSVIVLVAPNVDAICAARMLADLFKQDDLMHRIIPISGVAEFERIRAVLGGYAELHTLILLNLGAILDLISWDWFGNWDTALTVHVIDSARPYSLGNLFTGGEIGERIVVWDDGGIENLTELRKAWEALEYEPKPDSDEEDSDLEDEPEEDQDEDEDEYEDGAPSRKRRSLGDGSRAPGKRRRTDTNTAPRRMTLSERDHYQALLDRHYTSGSWYGQSCACTIYILATALERAVDNELLWLAIMGLTSQYTAALISRETYDGYHGVYFDEVARLNPAEGGARAAGPEDMSVRASEELRFMLFRHWTLYDAMFHSSYVASKLGIWKERGRKRLTGLLAKMGFSIPQTQQPYTHMDMDLKRHLRTKLESIAPEYGLLELTYPSFIRTYGYRGQPLSAADAVEAVGVLLDVAGGVRMDVEVEGARNGGEWFGGGRVWEGSGKAGHERPVQKVKAQPKEGEEAEAPEGAAEDPEEVPWWIRNFWAAYDALSDVRPLRAALPLAMSLHRAIVRQGTSIIDKQDIRTMRSHRVVILTQGPDLALFAHPGVLARLALWLVDALRDRVSPIPGRAGRKAKRSLPFVVACLKDEGEGIYVVVGVTAALEYGDVRRNDFNLAFLDASDRSRARTRHGTFDTNVVEVAKDDLKIFLEALCDSVDD
ncbi:hypothetical protein PLICRDRAFT_30098 [Plicaturopsis crispa FD-325 SS-3]|nr:hypothetical protein PLICRDRAFT_30098 [Plicaturopsis crispa FD-325 SS-3]